MMSAKRLWTPDETILALELYCRIPFGRCARNTPEVVVLATCLGRTPSSVAMKLVNMASLDPHHRVRGVSGLGHCSKLDREIWEEAHTDWNAFLDKATTLRHIRKLVVLDDAGFQPRRADEEEIPLREGRTRETVVHSRIGQAFFRTTILTGYGGRCCISGIDHPQLLVASHIVPWAKSPKERLNPRNGLCLCAIYDRAFDHGLLTVAPDYTIRFSPALQKRYKASPYREFFGKYDGSAIALPERWHPNPVFLHQHNVASGIVP